MKFISYNNCVEKVHQGFGRKLPAGGEETKYQLHFSHLLLGYTGLSDAPLFKFIEDSRRLWEGGLEQVRYISIGTHAGPGAVAVAFFKNQFCIA